MGEPDSTAAVRPDHDAARDAPTAMGEGGNSGGGGGGAKEEEAALNDLQQHLQLEACDGKYLTKQEILLLELYQAFTLEAGKNAAGSVAGGHTASSSGVDGTASTMAGGAPTSSTSAGAGKVSSSATTPKRPMTSDRERVQNFLAQRQNSTGGGSGSGSTTPRAGVPAAKPALSALDRAKALMAKKAVGVKPATARSATTTAASTAVKRSNPLADILKGGSGSVVGGMANVKRPRTKSDKPGEIKINGGRSSIQLPVESFLRSEDWDSASGTALEVVLPEAAFATNNTLIIHATMPQRSSRFCFNVSTQSSLLGGAPYPGTVLYHFNPRRQRGGQIIQNSKIDGRWGCSQPLPRCPITFGEPFTLRLTMVASGFLVFLEELFQDEFKHRVPVREGENLVLTVPTKDELGNPEGVIVHSVWWGHAEPPSNVDTMRPSRGLSGGYDRGRSFDDRGGGRGYRGGGRGRGFDDRGGGFHGMPHPFEVYVGNLPHGTSREELGFLFQYLGYETVRITARGFGFVTFRTAEDMHRAVEDLDGKDFNGMKLRVSCANK